MRGILSDANIQGHVRYLVTLLESQRWREVWASLNLAVRTFHEVGLADAASDALVWHTCQREELVLITANRNKKGPESLEATVQVQNTPACLPVFTIGNTEAIFQSTQYADRVVERMLEHLMNIDNLRGTGRLYLP